MGAGTFNTLHMKSPASPNGCFFRQNHVFNSTTTRLPFLQEFRYSRLVVRANTSFHQVNVGGYQTPRIDLKWKQYLTSHKTSTPSHAVGLVELEPALSVDLVVEDKIKTSVVEEKVEEKQDLKLVGEEKKQEDLKVDDDEKKQEDLKLVGDGKTQEVLKVDGDENLEDLKLDGGFVVPDSNAFGHSFRDYNKESERKASVEEFYRIQHISQTYEFATKKKEEYGKLDRAVMSIWECCELLNEFVDESDPDLDEPQIEHLLQTAEAIRRDHPNEDWLHLTALIHDLGKVLLHHGFGAEPQWAVVGDTFPLGCAFNEAIVHHQYFKDNPDYNNPKYNTKLGVYSENCGLDNVIMSWGHDEYMYLVAKENKTTLPPAALFIIRFHSFYALHRANTYTYLMNKEDEEMLTWLRVFNKYDLYSKSKVRINLEEVKPYYLSLIEKYFPAKLRW